MLELNQVKNSRSFVLRQNYRYLQIKFLYYLFPENVLTFNQKRNILKIRGYFINILYVLAKRQNERKPLMIGIIVLGHDHFADGISGSLEMLLGKAENYEKINYLPDDSLEDL